MRFNCSLLFGIIGVLATRGKDPDNDGELQAVRMELHSAYAEIAALKLEIVHLRAELDDCAEGHVCSDVVGLPFFCQSWSRSSPLPTQRSFRHTVAVTQERDQTFTDTRNDTQSRHRSSAACGHRPCKKLMPVLDPNPDPVLGPRISTLTSSTCQCPS